MPLFGSSGIRKIADVDLLGLALRTGLATGALYRTAIVGGDTRTSSEAVKHAFISGLLAAGARVWDGGMMPTPTLALAARRFQAGAMITASHNPPEYNGIKLLNPDGSAFDARQREQIESLVISETLAAAPWADMQNSRKYDGAIEEHIEHIRKAIRSPLKLKVALDCGCGAASVITPYLLRQLGCEVVALNCYPGGFFPRDAEPAEANLGDLMRATREFGADLGIAHDGDGDRMMAVDDRGRFIPGDKLLAIFALHSGSGEIVTTLDTSMMIEELGIKVTRTKIGDIYVSEELKRGGGFGGEPSGAWVFPENSLCPDGIYAAARLLAIASQERLSTLVDRMPRYPILRGSVAADGTGLDEMERRLLALQPASISRVDGIRFSFDDGWVLIRPSGTEPKVRLTAEAKNEARARYLFDRGLKIVKECCASDKEK